MDLKELTELKIECLKDKLLNLKVCLKFCLCYKDKCCILKKIKKTTEFLNILNKK